MKKKEKYRIDFDMDFWLGFGMGVLANLIASYLYDWIPKKPKQETNNLNRV